MNSRKVLLAISCLVAVAGLISGMTVQWWWVGLVLCALLAAAWTIKLLRRLDWLASLSLGVYLCAAAVGMMLGGNALFLVIGGMAALAAWDLISFGSSLGGVEDNAGLRRCTLEHLKSLGAALGCGAVLVLPVLLIKIQLPFNVMLALLAAALGGLLAAYRLLQKKNTP